LKVTHRVDSRFGGLLAIRTKLIPKPLAWWLLEKYDQWDMSLNLPRGKLLIYDQDMHATLVLPMGQFKYRSSKIQTMKSNMSNSWSSEGEDEI